MVPSVRKFSGVSCFALTSKHSISVDDSPTSLCGLFVLAFVFSSWSWISGRRMLHMVLSTSEVASSISLKGIEVPKLLSGALHLVR